MEIVDNIFTENEVRKKLSELGYGDIPNEHMQIFMEDLNELVKHETSRSSEYDTTREEDGYVTTDSEMYEHANVPNRGLQNKSYTKSKVLCDDSEEKENAGYKKQRTLRKQSPRLSISSANSENIDLDSSRASSVTRRKVARKRDGVVRVFDETLTETESEASDITLIEERLRTLPFKDDQEEYKDDRDSSISSTSFCTKGYKGILPSYIRPVTAPTNRGRSRRFDPVNRYHQFKEEWKLQGVPGERRHNSLRWNVREQMLNCQVYERPQHSHKPNNYQVPTRKKRQSLRWEVRCALAKI